MPLATFAHSAQSNVGGGNDLSSNLPGWFRSSRYDVGRPDGICQNTEPRCAHRERRLPCYAAAFRVPDGHDSFVPLLVQPGNDVGRRLRGPDRGSPDASDRSRVRLIFGRPEAGVYCE
jgi:hypothetical protein